MARLSALVSRWRHSKLNRLLPKLLLAFWLTSMLSVGTVLGLPLLLKQWDQLPLQPQFQAALDRVANRLDNNPNLSIEQINRVLHRKDLRQLLPPEAAMAEPSSKHHRDKPSFKFYLVDGNGNVLQQHSRRLPRQLREYLLEFDRTQPQQRQIDGKLIFGPKPLANGNYLIGSINALKRPWLAQLWNRPGLLLLLTTVVSTLVFGLLAWSLSKPLRQLKATAGAIASGDLDARITPKISQRGDEIGQVAENFNRMAHSVSTMVHGQQRLLSDISHELRTPLTRLQLSLAIARRKGQHSDELTRIGSEADTLEAMLQELLSLSRLNMQVTERKTALDLVQVLAPVIAGIEFEAEATGKQIQVAMPTSVTLNGVESLLQRLVENPLRNALRYAKALVQLQIESTQTAVMIRISDDGPGVPEAELERIFKPFHRIDSARDRDSGGWGLGLAITQGAVDAHQGQLHASNRPQGGLCLEIRLPV
ncbi:ATP-binding protein [Ferrimonas senticii]|uniref:ATP-binding protein n=1 Tax=Ferrimonas senticii TaxID=394566 RepID=UPI00042569DA|nr:ATP-binding protein [Ferrimonas senticii]